ncbi:efflux transporter outer membrane subunit [Aristophania vespae]|uniref:efflux transporter outer membrane subunit n=1 Tax=Aristophania vespae TaxID=2697033 RepID=UPI0023510A75|nr:efflux transporter outer membrane subunit [Aristophania vespae]UMM63998.1 Outer membrane protein OprM [Aristophania vespae]
MTMSKYKYSPLLTSFLFISLCGCVIGPKGETPPLPAHTDYRNTPLKHTAGQDSKDSALRRQDIIQGLDIPGKWWEVFKNPQLNSLIEQALANNHDLKAMQEGLKVAWEQRRVEGAALYPTISAQFIPSRNKTSKALSNVPYENQWLYNLHTAQLNIGYVPDLWGGERQAIRAAAAQANIQRFQLEATALTLISNIVNGAITEASFRAQIAAKQALIAQQKEILSVTEKQQKLGDQSKLDSLMQQNALAQLEADLPPLQRDLAQTRNQLATLAGMTPNQDLPVFTLDDFTLPEKMPLSLPSALLEQRPDIRAAQEQMHAAAAEVGIAIANRLPNLQLSAMPGQIVGHMSQMFKTGYGNWDLMATITQPIFQGGSLLHAQRAAKKQLHQATETYKSTVLSAVGDVSDSLHAIQYDSEALLAEQKSLDTAQKSYKIALARKKLGDISQIELLAAQSAVAQSQLSFVQAKAVRFSDSVGLFQALGGGWWHRNDLGLPPEEAKRLSTSLAPW